MKLVRVMNFFKFKKIKIKPHKYLCSDVATHVLINIRLIKNFLIIKKEKEDRRRNTYAKPNHSHQNHKFPHIFAPRNA